MAMDSAARSTSGLQRLMVYYSGQVQGVGFRQSVCEVAAGFKVAGFVQNLHDGRVQLTVEGTFGEVEPFLATIRSRLHRNIAACDQHIGSATGEWSDFSIQY